MSGLKRMGSGLIGRASISLRMVLRCVCDWRRMMGASLIGSGELTTVSPSSSISTKSWVTSAREPMPNIASYSSNSRLSRCCQQSFP